MIGIPDAEAGEVPKAFVVKRDAQLKAEDVKRFVKGMLIIFPNKDKIINLNLFTCVKAY